ncbi:hypothetical protein OAV61_01620 [Flavobacteriaceae bacterium]|nr:hypothetical protein [Flavobacteriaceae bacterium]
MDKITPYKPKNKVRIVTAASLFDGHDAKFELRGIVLSGVLGLEFKEGVKKIPSSKGFLIPKNTRVRIFNAGSEELVLIEVLRPGYQKELVTFFEDFNN